MISLLIIIHTFTVVFLISNHLLSSECQTVVLNKLINKYILKFNCMQLLWIILIIQAFHQKCVRETASVLFLNRSLRSWILISSSLPLVVQLMVMFIVVIFSNDFLLSLLTSIIRWSRKQFTSKNVFSKKWNIVYFLCVT